MAHTGTDDKVLEGNSGKQVGGLAQSKCLGIGEFNHYERERKVDRKGTRQ